MTVHDYRKAIDDDCIVGVCSQNNCLYPWCVPAKNVDPDRASPGPVIVAGICLVLFMLLVFR